MNLKSPATVTTVVWYLLNILICILGYVLINVPNISNYLGQELSSGVGASLIAAGVTGILLYLYTSRTERIRNQLDALGSAGIEQVFEGRSTRIKDEYDARTEKALELDIIGFGLSQFREDHANNFSLWSHTKQVRILLLDPTFPDEDFSHSDQRDSEEKNYHGRIRSDIEKFAEVVQTAVDIDTGQFQVKYMTTLPAINMFRFDDEIFWGPYLINRQSRNTMTLVTRRGGFVFNQLTAHFDAIWNSESFSRPI